MDDASAAEAAPAPAKRSREGKGGKTRNYSDAALATNQWPITALIPTRGSTLAVMALAGLIVVTLLNLLHAELPRLARLCGGAEGLAALDLTARGSLAGWFSSLLLAWSAIMAAQTYNLRRYRVDDYKGRYRVWLWVPVLLVVASIDAATGLHAAIGGAMMRLGGGKTLGPDACWLALAAAVSGAAALRVAIEMRRSVAALVWLFGALTSYGLAAALRAGLLAAPIGYEVFAGTTAALAGHLLLWLTLLVYARYVYLDAQGLLVPRKKAAPKKKKDESKPAADAGEVAEKDSAQEKTVGGKQVRIDAAHGSSRGKEEGAVTRPAAISAASVKSPAPVAAGAGESRKMSKAERKRLRKLGRSVDDDDE